ncbi:WD repeat-containing protein 75 [Desmophyllum pertusum]|uniref:WD repeat-containing protein 75 n=1 Tax=Desmophyllum pertusum TaxID=174260 RepID=A0A9W9Z5E7_9CNID|nr:WD repeat-containing protein 75 [Desmophyllum pertusum]
MSKLYFLSKNQELFTLECGEATDEESQAMSQQSMAGQFEEQTEFFKIFGQSAKSKGESTSEQRVGKSVKGTPSSTVVRQMMQTPSHVLPSVTSLCSSFLQSLLVSKQTSQREDQVDAENDASESEDESMEEEDDSDGETATQGASGQVNNSLVKMTNSGALQRHQLSTAAETSNLDNVNFTWLQDYFTSS